MRSSLRITSCGTPGQSFADEQARPEGPPRLPPHPCDATWAHLTVVMASLAVARYLQEATGISIARIVRELRGLQEVTINLNGHRITAAPRLTDAANDILTTLSTPPPAHYAS